MKHFIKPTVSVFLALSAALNLPAASFEPDTLGATQAVARSVAELIEGEIAGVRVSRTSANPLSPVSVDIRGTSTLRGDNQPLWIVDGAMIGNASGTDLNPFWNYSSLSRPENVNSFFHLSPYDIESIEVLKDASATARYGSRGAAGVIIVKTKLSGDCGRGGRENGFQWNSNLGYDPGASGFFHNHRLNFGMSGRGTSFNTSLSYRGLGGGVVGLGSDDLMLRTSFESKSSKILWLGASFIGGLGRFDNSGTALPDYEDDGKRYGATASAWLRFNICPGLHWITTAGGDYRGNTRFVWYGNGNEIGAAYNGLAGISSTSALSYNVRSDLNFSRYFATDHRFTAGFGAEYYGSYNNYNALGANDHFAHEMKAKGISIANSYKPSYIFSENPGHYAIYGNLGYAYKDFAGVDASYRADRTFTSFDGRYDLYPSASLWLELHNMLFRDSRAVSSLRIDGGYGVSGNERPLVYPFFGTVADASSLPDVSRDRQIYFDARSYQRVNEWNVGLKAGFLAERIVLELGYFERIINDSFDIYDSGQMGTDGKWHRSQAVLNSTRTSDFSSRGFEMALSASVIRSRNVVWTLKGNCTVGKTQVLSVDDNDVWYSSGYAGGGYYAANVAGYPVGTIMGYEVGSDGYYVDRVPDGKIDRADCVVLGNLIPEVYGGFGTTLRIYDFTLDLDADYAAGFDVIDGASMISENRTVLTSRYVSRGDFLRLSRAVLSYNIPLPECSVKGLSVSLSGHNLFTLSRFAGAYPESSIFGLNPLARGNDCYGTALVPSVVVGACIKF